MNSTPSATSAFLLRPAATLAEMLAALRDTLRAYRHVDEVHRRPAPPTDDLAGLSEHVLKDIGAPDRMIARAIARRQASLGHELDWPSYSPIR